MDREINPVIKERMRALSEQISVARDLDPELQEELYGHLEDKLLAYMDGSEQITEEDAFILVREHVGQPRVLNKLLRRVHGQKVEAALLRQAAAALIAFTAAYALTNLTMLAAQMFAARADVASGTWTYLRPLVFAAEHVALILPIALTWPLLAYWRRKTNHGQTAWYVTARPGALIALFLAVLVASHAIPYPGETQVQGSPLGPIPRWEDFLDSIAPFFLGLQCLIWIWWCDRAPRSLGTALRGVALWVIWWMLISPVLLGMTQWKIVDTVAIGNPLWMSVDTVAMGTQFWPAGEIARGTFSHSQFQWYLQAQIPAVLQHPGLLLGLPFYALQLAVIPCLLYLATERVRSWRNDNPVAETE